MNARDREDAFGAVGAVAQDLRAAYWETCTIAVYLKTLAEVAAEGTLDLAPVEVGCVLEDLQKRQEALASRLSGLETLLGSLASRAKGEGAPLPA